MTLSSAPLIALLVAGAFSIDGGLAAGYQKVDADFGYVAVDPRDVAAAITEGAAARRAADSVFLLEDARFAIVEEGSGDARWGGTDGGLVTYTWTFPHGSRRFKSRPAITLLRHEIGHHLFARHLVPSTHANRYGTDAPDWLDEMAAIAFEGADQRASRRRDAANLRLLSLASLLRMDHPELEAPVVRETGQAFTSSAVSSPQTMPFYATVSCFYEFLAAKTGRMSIVAELARAFTRGEDLEVWLPDRLGYGREGSSLALMNADFVRWFESEAQPAVAR